MIFAVKGLGNFIKNLEKTVIKPLKLWLVN
jgi:hypothetical protein